MENKFISENYADLLIENNSILAREFSEQLIITRTRYSILHVPIEEIDKCSVSTYGFSAFPNCYGLESITSLEKSGVTTIQNNPNLGLFGQGVLVGIIDTGIEYTHEAFIKSDNTTKIEYIWDQTITDDENISDHIMFGTEYNREQINMALNSENPLEIVPSNDEIGHGTMISGIITGNESLGNNFRGVAPDADLVVVKLKDAKRVIKDFYAIPNDVFCFQETDILLAISYLLEKADELNKPMVICIAFGTSLTDHSGTGPLGRYIAVLSSAQNISIVVSGGNEGNSRRHYLGNIESTVGYDDFELRVGPGETGFSMMIWERVPNLLSIAITSPSGEVINPVYPTINECRRISLIFERTVIYIYNIFSESESGDQLIFIRMEYPTEGIWRFRAGSVTNSTTFFNAWLPSGEAVSNGTYFLNSDPETTLTAPSDALYPLSVTAYDSASDSIWINSSRGYTRLEFIKPDLAAPGVNISCPILRNSYGSATGTGVAAAHSAGIVAMILEWGVVKENYITINGTEIKQILIRGAKRDNNLSYPNKVWGYGIIDVFGAFDNLT